MTYFTVCRKSRKIIVTSTWRLYPKGNHEYLQQIYRSRRDAAIAGVSSFRLAKARAVRVVLFHRFRVSHPLLHLQRTTRLLRKLSVRHPRLRLRFLHVVLSSMATPGRLSDWRSRSWRGFSCTRRRPLTPLQRKPLRDTRPARASVSRSGFAFMR